MINRARKKFIIWAMIAMTAIVVILTAAVNIVNRNLTDRNLSETLRELAEEQSLNGPRSEAEAAAGTQEQMPGGKVEESSGYPKDMAGKEFGERTGKPAEESGETTPALESAGKGLSKETPDPGIPAEDGLARAEWELQIQNGQYKQDGRDGHGRSSAYIQYKNRYFIVILDKEGQPLNNSWQSDIISEEDALALAENSLETGSMEGYLDEYRYLIYKEENGNTLLCFLDCTTNFRAMDTLLLVSVIVGAAGILLGFLFILFMSGKIVEPVRISIEKQKQFITNAGHELKTPLSAIATNMDILTMDLGDNEWVDGTKKQVRRLRKLVENMVALSRMEEEDQEILMQSFSISDIAQECADGFSSIARMRGKEMDIDIAKDLSVRGDPGMIQQLISILCDNALKYASGSGPVRIRLYKEGRHVIFSTANPWEHDVDEDQIEALFDRFYRGDPARAQEHKSAGYGLGLSIARAMAEKNQAKLAASVDEQGWIVFRAVFQAEKL